LFSEAADRTSYLAFDSRVVGMFKTELYEDFAAFSISLKTVKCFSLAEEGFLSWFSGRGCSGFDI
jgi:hypothetical protein